MQKQAHTPGPWRVEQQDDMDVEGNGYVWAVRAEGHGSYCQNPARSNSLANARLMAASPCLLAALYATLGIVEQVFEEDAGSFNDDLGALITEARAAIAKAQGAPE
jgi:hypothetical protein